MRFGLFGVNFQSCADPEVQRRVALAAEESGFESVWTGEHVALPIRDNPVPTPAETPFLDALVSLGRIAGFTTRLRLGTGAERRTCNYVNRHWPFEEDQL